MEEEIRIAINRLSDRAKNRYVVYILRSVSEPNLFYCGMTNNIHRRLRQHNGLITGGGKYTSANRPWKLAAIIYSREEEFTKSEALKIEYHTKAKNLKVTVPYSDKSVRKRAWLILHGMEYTEKSCKLRCYDRELRKEVRELK